jgi:hypothetical protein
MGFGKYRARDAALGQKLHFISSCYLSNQSTDRENLKHSFFLMRVDVYDYLKKSN